MATKHKRATMTARQLAEDYLAHQITRDVTRTSTRHHLNQLLALFGGWQARRVGAAQMQEFLAAQQARGVMATTAHHRVRLCRSCHTPNDNRTNKKKAGEIPPFLFYLFCCQ